MPPPSPSWHHVWSLEKLRRHVRASARADRFDFQDAVGLTQILLQIDPLPPRPRSFSRTTARTYLKSQNCLRRMQTAASQNPGVSSVAVLGFSGLHSPPRLHLGFQVAVMRATFVVTARRQVRRFAPARHINKRLPSRTRSLVVGRCLPRCGEGAAPGNSIPPMNRLENAPMMTPLTCIGRSRPNVSAKCVPRYSG